ncbi:MAG: hypothetical protein ACPG8W_02880 [Candidatus Promineifilaceae bacterium]
MITKAPAFQLTSVASNRLVGVPDSQPSVLILLFQAESTADAAQAVNEQIRRVHEASEDLIIASVVDLGSVPRFMRKMGEKMLAMSYKKAVASFPEGHNPADYVILLPDWSGEVFRKFGVGDVSKKALMIIIDHEGNIVFKRQGGNLGKAALKELDKLV